MDDKQFKLVVSMLGGISESLKEIKEEITFLALVDIDPIRGMLGQLKTITEKVLKEVSELNSEN